MSTLTSEAAADQPNRGVSWKVIPFLAALSLPYLVLALGPFLVYGIPWWRSGYSDPRDFWLFGYTGLGEFLLVLALRLAEVTPILLPISAIIMFVFARRGWQQHGTGAKSIISLSLAVTVIIGVSSWVFGPYVAVWLRD